MVFFEVGWKLVDMETGRPLYQPALRQPVAGAPDRLQPPQIRRRRRQSAPGAPAAGARRGGTEFREIVPGGPRAAPGIRRGERHARAAAGHRSRAKARTCRSADGIADRVRGEFGRVHPDEPPCGLGVARRATLRRAGRRGGAERRTGQQKLTPISGRQFPRWVPAKARFIVRGRLDLSSPLVSQAYSGKALEGRNDYLDVTFPRNRERVQAKLVRISDQADVAMVKIDMPRALRKLECSDNYNTIAQGDHIYVLGYPGVSPAVMGAVQSRKRSRPSTEVKVIPDPTLSVGNIGRVIRGKAGLTEAPY